MKISELDQLDWDGSRSRAVSLIGYMSVTRYFSYLSASKVESDPHILIDLPQLEEFLISSAKVPVCVGSCVLFHFKCRATGLLSPLGVTPFRYVLSGISEITSTESGKTIELFKQ